MTNDHKSEFDRVLQKLQK